MIGYLRSNTGDQKKVKVGFSWTTFFLGFFVPLFRKDVKWAVVIILISFGLGAMSGGFLTIPANIGFAFMYNKFYIQGLIAKGYMPVGNDFANLLRQSGIEFNNYIQDQIGTNTYSNNESIF